MDGWKDLRRLAVAACAGLAVGFTGQPAEAAGDQTGPECLLSKDGRVEPPDVGAKQCIASPDRQKLTIVNRGQISVRYRGKTYPLGVMDYGRIIWSPDSDGFAIEDSGGSGESSYFSYVDVSAPRPERLKTLRLSAAKLYAQRFNCLSRRSYVYSWIDGWQDAKHIRLVVQEGVHSERCSHSDPEEIEIGVVGEPRTGRITRVLTQRDVVREWCSAQQRREYGFCYVRASASH